MSPPQKSQHDFRVRSVVPSKNKLDSSRDISADITDHSSFRVRERASTVCKTAETNETKQQTFPIQINLTSKSKHQNSPLTEESLIEPRSRTRSNAIYIKTQPKQEKQGARLKLNQQSSSGSLWKPPLESLFESFMAVTDKQQERCSTDSSHIRSLFKHFLFADDCVTDKLLVDFLKEIKEDVIAIKDAVWPPHPKALAALSDIDPSKKVLLLDLDETLVHSQFDQVKKQLHVKVRPFAREFLEHCSKLWNLVAFTASNRTYAESILDRLDPNNNLVSNILSREHCHPHGNRFVKDFRMVAGPLTPLDRIVLIDNRVSSFGMNLTNGIPIFPF